MAKNQNPFSFNSRELIKIKRNLSPSGKEIITLEYKISEMTPQGTYRTYEDILTYPPLKNGVHPKNHEDIRECEICNELFTKEDVVKCEECGIVMCKEDAESDENDDDDEKIWLCPDHKLKRTGFFVRLWKSIFEL